MSSLSRRSAIEPSSCLKESRRMDSCCVPSHQGLRLLRREDYRWKYVLVRSNQYLNNVVEQDHRAIKGRCRPMMGFKSHRTAALTLAGIELAHRIRKRQFIFGPGRWTDWSLKKQWEIALA